MIIKPQMNIYELIYIILLSFLNRLLRIKPFGDIFLYLMSIYDNKTIYKYLRVENIYIFLKYF